MVETAGGGSIVNISSRSASMVQTAFVAYGAAKAALNMMTRNIAACALYLASPASSWVTGKIFEVDGGTEAPAFLVPVPSL